KICVVGELQNRSYEAKDGTKRTVTEIIADDIEFLTPRQESDSVLPDVSEFADVYEDNLPF
ncbi:MAG: single-stranded DNA-binding protein, partial [Clostridia bacterium]